MNTSHFDTNHDSEESPSILLGEAIRRARKNRGWTIADLAEKIGRRREWLNRIELGHSEYGEHRPPSASDVESLINLLRDNLDVSPEKLLELRHQSEKNFNSLNVNSRANKRDKTGKLTQAEVVIGEAQLYKAATNLIKEQHSDAIIRNTGIWSLAPSYLEPVAEWENYRHVIGQFLNSNPHSVLKRVEYVGTNEHLKMASESDKWASGGRPLDRVHNAKVKYFVRNPLLLDVLIGQREAILALPQSTGHSDSSMAIVVRDKLFVEALRVWFDEVLWEYPVDSQSVNYQDFDGSFAKIKKMYGF